MTYDQAHALLDEAPADGAPCALNPAMTRGQARDACRFSVSELESIGIGIGPELEASILGLAGRAVSPRIAAYMRQKAAMLAQSPNATIADCYSSFPFLSQWTSRSSATVTQEQIKALVEGIEARNRQAALGSLLPREKPKSNGHPAAKQPAQAPEPKPDLSSPTFVLKRPRRL